MDDAPPLQLTDDDFFSDIDGDESYAGDQTVGRGSRLVIDMVGNESGNRSSRTNPFSGTEVRTRNTSSRNSNKSNGIISLVNTASESENEMQIRSSVRHSLQETDRNRNQLTLNGTSEDRITNNHANSSEDTSTLGIRSHCHVVAKTDESNIVRNQLIAISVVTTLFACGEMVGTVYSKSVAIGTDVMHLISDILSFIISLVAVYLAKKNPTARLPWGYHRAEVLGALLSVFIIWVVTGVLVYLAANRIKTNTYGQLDPDDMLYTSIAGVVFNIIMAVVLNVEIFNCKVSHGHSHGSHGHSHGSHGHSHSHRQTTPSQRRSGEYEPLAASGEEADERDTDTSDETQAEEKGKREKNIVIRAAFVHVLGDLIQSLGVFVAAIIIKFKGAEENSVYRLADPICTFTFSVLVLITTSTVMADAFFILMEASPKKVNYSQIYEALMQLEGIKSVHSLKVWSLTPNEVNASVHLTVDADHPFPFDLVSKANAILREDEIITRSTVQVEVHDEHNARNCVQCLHPRPQNTSLII